MKCFEILNIAFCQYVSITLTGVTSLGVVCWQFWASAGGTKEQGDCTLQCGASGRGPDKLHASFAGKGGKMPALLSSEFSTTCPRAVWQHVVEQLSGGVAVTPPGRPTEKNCCCQTRLNPHPFPQSYWLHTILRQLCLPWFRPGTGKANDDSLWATHPPAHPPPLAWPLNETSTQWDNLSGTKCFSPFPSKLFPNLTAELEAPHSTPSVECSKSEITSATPCWDFRPVSFFKLMWHLSLC